MCGIWGLVGKKTNKRDEIELLIKDLFIFSESRGKEASGIAAIYNSRIMSYKKPEPASTLIQSKKFGKFLDRALSKENDIMAVIGHSRLATNGCELDEVNNQPVCYGGLATVHNGIIVNADDLWEKYKYLQRKSELDTEIFAKIIDNNYLKGMDEISAYQSAYKEIQGTASTVTLFSKSGRAAAGTNNGSLYFWRSSDQMLMLFASEKYIFHELYAKNAFVKKYFFKDNIVHISANQGVMIDARTLYVRKISFDNYAVIKYGMEKLSKSADILNDRYAKFEIDIEPIKRIRRCTKCVLPSTMPFIEFDAKGVCNYCRTYKKMEYKGLKALNRWADRTKTVSAKKEYNSIVSFSGGRDSSYGLHYFVKELDLKPVAYNYDWGMVTDLARRNQARMCAALGVELITVSANIRKKRENIRKNIVAWMRNPSLGLVPLFMAGDKAYFYYANVMKKRFGLNSILLASNPFEATLFKSGFCGVKPGILKSRKDNLEIEQLVLRDTLKMALYYIRQYASNKKYINASLVDTMLAALSYYMIPHDYFRLYDYIPWDEDMIDDVLINEYDWETAADIDSTWRIGDGTAPFYNYIYYSVCGFTENDTLRSNQIREGKLSREKALELVYRDNQPRWDALRWYFDTVGLEMDLVLNRVNKMEKLY